jgi:hypothetical protein
MYRADLTSGLRAPSVPGTPESFFTGLNVMSDSCWHLVRRLHSVVA